MQQHTLYGERSPAQDYSAMATTDNGNEPATTERCSSTVDMFDMPAAGLQLDSPLEKRQEQIDG